jgi:histidinol-phosphatase (PHP family)
MSKILTDVHTHSRFSADGKSFLDDMVATAAAKNAAFYGVSEHFDYDYKVNNIPFYGGAQATYTDAEAYFTHARELQKKYANRMEILVGGEFGFTDNPAATPLYKALIADYRPDFVVNSVHSNGSHDFSDKATYYDKNGNLREQREVFTEYLTLVRKSVDAQYDYDIIGHLTYCMRYAPYDDKRLRLADYGEEIDGILKAIIARGKILEANSSNRGAPCDFLPDVEVFSRYYELGGRLVSFGSDAHHVDRVLEKRELVTAALKKIGFEYITVPKRGEYLKIEI